MEPAFGPALNWLAITLALLGKAEEAIVRARAAAKLMPDDPGADCTLAGVYALLGRREEAEATLDRMLDRGAVYPIFLAMIYSALGRENEMFESLERCYEARIDWMYSIGAQPAFAHYRSHPRFIALLERLGLPRT